LADLKVGDSAMWRKWEAGKPIVSQIVPDLVSDFGLAVTYNTNNDKYLYQCRQWTVV